MSKTVTFVQDVYPYCVGDVVVLNDDEVKAVDKVAKTRDDHKVYVNGAKAEVDSSVEADRQAAELEAQVKPDEAQAKVDLEVASALKDDAEGHTARSGRVVPGTSGDTTLTTAAAANKKH